MLHGCKRLFAGLQSMAMTQGGNTIEAAPVVPVAGRVRARALLLGDRIDTAGLERSDLVSTAPLAFHVGVAGFAVLYKFGVAVLFGLSPIEEDEILTTIDASSGPRRSATMRVSCSRSLPRGRIK